MTEACTATQENESAASRSDYLDAMSRAVTGVNVVTSDGPARRAGLTVSAMSSVSVDGPAPQLLVELCDLVTMQPFRCIVWRVLARIHQLCVLTEQLFAELVLQHELPDRRLVGEIGADQDAEVVRAEGVLVAHAAELVEHVVG